MDVAMIGKGSGQSDLPAWGIEHKPGVLDRIDEELDWSRFGKTLRKVFKDYFPFEGFLVWRSMTRFPTGPQSAAFASDRPKKGWRTNCLEN